MKTKIEIKKLALERIEQLFNEAKHNHKMADRYVELARKIAMKSNLSMPRLYKKKFCKHCYKYFKEGNYRVRTRNGMLVYYCLNCKKYMKLKLK